MNWEEWVYRFLPFTMNWFRVFVIKSIFIILVVFLFDVIKKASVPKKVVVSPTV